MVTKIMTNPKMLTKMMTNKAEKGVCTEERVSREALDSISS